MKDFDLEKEYIDINEGTLLEGGRGRKWEMGKLVEGEERYLMECDRFGAKFH